MVEDRGLTSKNDIINLINSQIFYGMKNFFLKCNKVTLKKTYKNITLIISKIKKDVIYICLKKIIKKKNQYHHLNRDQRAQIEILINENDKTFEEIKVSDICKKALINRSTFYSHYNDKYELLVDFINVLKEEFVNE